MHYSPMTPENKPVAELPAELSAKARAVVQRARELVQKRKAQGGDRAEAMRAFEKNLNEITEAL